MPERNETRDPESRSAIYCCNSRPVAHGSRLSCARAHSAGTRKRRCALRFPAHRAGRARDCQQCRKRLRTAHERLPIVVNAPALIPPVPRSPRRSRSAALDQRSRCRSPHRYEWGDRRIGSRLGARSHRQGSEYGEDACHLGRAPYAACDRRHLSGRGLRRHQDLGACQRRDAPARFVRQPQRIAEGDHRSLRARAIAHRRNQRTWRPSTWPRTARPTWR